MASPLYLPAPIKAIPDSAPGEALNAGQPWARRASVVSIVELDNVPSGFGLQTRREGRGLDRGVAARSSLPPAREPFHPPTLQPSACRRDNFLLQKASSLIQFPLGSCPPIPINVGSMCTSPLTRLV